MNDTQKQQIIDCLRKAQIAISMIKYVPSIREHVQRYNDEEKQRMIRKVGSNENKNT